MLPLLATALFPVIVICVIFLAVVWAIVTYVPMSAGAKRLVSLLAIVGLCVWLSRVFGLWEWLSQVRV